MRPPSSSIFRTGAPWLSEELQGINDFRCAKNNSDKNRMNEIDCGYCQPYKIHQIKTPCRSKTTFIRMAAVTDSCK